MNYQDLKNQTLEKCETSQAEYKKLFSLAGVGGQVKDCLKPHLEKADTLDEFYEAVYADDACKYENVWGYWAKLKHPEWPSRFHAERGRLGVRLQLRGITVEGKSLQFYIPMTGRNRRADVFEFVDGNVNEAALDYFTSVSGSFTCLDMEFAGTYDIFVGPRLIVFERWEFDKLGNRLNGKGETKMCCKCR